MNTTKRYKFSPSANLERDFGTALNYIPTPNSKQIFNQIVTDYLFGNRAFSIIGSYGTGKSSFLLAFANTLSQSKNHFPDFRDFIKNTGAFEFIPVVGEYDSLTSALASVLGYKRNANYRTSQLLQDIKALCKANSRKKKSTAIVIDEFGKFLEYAAKHNPEKELYFIQQLAELANDEKNQLLLLTTLHQDFNAYSFDLSKSQQNEWDKVKGRLKEITFNEPVEQLLFLAAERISQKFEQKKNDKSFHQLFNVIKESRTFPLRDYFDENIAQRLLPFDILSASILTLSLQRYGQNERSLFSFIESNDHLGINEFHSRNEDYFNIGCVYDYLAHNHNSFISSKNNPNYVQWNSIKLSVQRAEGLFEKKTDIDNASTIVKTIGLLNIFASATARLERNFLTEYFKLACGVKNSDELITRLEKQKVIRYVKHSFKYILFHGTDLDIELAINNAGKLVERVTNVVDHLNIYFEFPFIPAKEIFFRKGTPRFFQFVLSETPIFQKPEGEVDGFINLIFSEDISERQLQDASSRSGEAILYGLYKNTNEIKEELYEIRKVKKVMEIHPDDKVAQRELKEILNHHIKLLNHFVFGSLYSNKNIVKWYAGGVARTIQNRRQFNERLSEICDEVYNGTPIFKNELVNKTNVHGQISKARRDLLTHVFKNAELENLGFAPEEFPPQKTIYLSLLANNGMHRKVGGYYQITAPTAESFLPLWQNGIDFLNESKSDKRNLAELFELFAEKPFKLKKGFLDIWVPLFLIARKETYALYDSEGAFIPELSNDVIDLVLKKPSAFQLKAFDVSGIKKELFNRYRKFLNQSSDVQMTNESYIETIKPFLTFYRKLPEYTQQTKKNLPKPIVELRERIAKATDPEKAFFYDFPEALGYNISMLKNNTTKCEEYIQKLQSSIQRLQSCYDELLNKFESFLVRDILQLESKFPDYKESIKNRFVTLKKHLLHSEQKSFYARLTSDLDDRGAWLSSLALSCIGKSLQNITDDEEEILFDILRNKIYELDNFCELSKDVVNEAEEEILMFQVTSFVEGLDKRVLRISKKQQAEAEEKVELIKKKLTSDNKLNLTILVKLIQETLKKK